MNHERMLRVVSFNIRHAKGLDGRVALGRIAAVLREIEPDVIGLQEVDQGWARSGSVDQAAWLGETLTMNQVMIPAFSKARAHYGLAVLSRYPICACDSWPLPSQGEPRVLARVLIDLGPVKLTVFNTHLGLDHTERLSHIERIILPKLPQRNPGILTGDFNALPASLELARFRTRLAESSLTDGCLTYPAGNPDERIDYILHTSGIQLDSIQAVSTDASDHCPLAADLRIWLPNQTS